MELNKTDRRVLLGLGKVLAIGAVAQLVPSSAFAQNTCDRSPRQGRKEFAHALGGDARCYNGAVAFADRYRKNAKVRSRFQALVTPVMDKAKNGEDFAREFEDLGRFVSDGVPQPQNCFGIIFLGIILVLAVIILLE